MISLFKKLLLLTLVTGIVPPICAMDAGQESGWFSWKSAAAGVTVVVAACVYWVYTNRQKPVAKYRETVKPAAKPAVQAQPQPAKPVKPAFQEDELNLDNLTPEFFEQQRLRIDKEIAELERAIALEEKATAEKRDN